MHAYALWGAIPAGIVVIVLQNVNGGELKNISSVVLCILFMHTYIVKIVLPVYWSRAPNVWLLSHPSKYNIDMCV